MQQITNYSRDRQERQRSTRRGRRDGARSTNGVRAAMRLAWAAPAMEQTGDKGRMDLRLCGRQGRRRPRRRGPGPAGGSACCSRRCRVRRGAGLRGRDNGGRTVARGGVWRCRDDGRSTYSSGAVWGGWSAGCWLLAALGHKQASRHGIVCRRGGVRAGQRSLRYCTQVPCLLACRTGVVAAARLGRCGSTLLWPSAGAGSGSGLGAIQGWRRRPANYRGRSGPAGPRRDGGRRSAGGD